jgi:hypothetical protein
MRGHHCCASKPLSHSRPCSGGHGVHSTFACVPMRCRVGRDAAARSQCSRRERHWRRMHKRCATVASSSHAVAAGASQTHPSGELPCRPFDGHAAAGPRRRQAATTHEAVQPAACSNGKNCLSWLDGPVASCCSSAALMAWPLPPLMARPAACASASASASASAGLHLCWFPEQAPHGQLGTEQLRRR